MAGFRPLRDHHLRVLGLQDPANTKDIRKAFRKISRENLTNKLVGYGLSNAEIKRRREILIAARAAYQYLVKRKTRFESQAEVGRATSWASRQPSEKTQWSPEFDEDQDADDEWSTGARASDSEVEDEGDPKDEKNAEHQGEDKDESKDEAKSRGEEDRRKYWRLRLD